MIRISLILVLICITGTPRTHSFSVTPIVSSRKISTGISFYANKGGKEIDIVTESLSEAREEAIRAELEDFKQQSQIKALATVAVALGAFFYLKIQYDIDPSKFVGSH